MQRRKFGREFKIEAVRLIKERGVSVAQASVARSGRARERAAQMGSGLRRRSGEAFPGHGQVKPEQLETDKLRQEVAKLKAERDILKKRQQPASRRM